MSKISAQSQLRMERLSIVLWVWSHPSLLVSDLGQCPSCPISSSMPSTVAGHLDLLTPTEAMCLSIIFLQRAVDSMVGYKCPHLKSPQVSILSGNACPYLPLLWLWWIPDNHQSQVPDLRGAWDPTNGQNCLSMRGPPYLYPDEVWRFTVIFSKSPRD